MSKIIDIWAPRFHDHVVLIATFKVTGGTNLIRFTKSKAYEGMTFSASGDEIRDCPIESNGRINCYAVPMDLLHRI